MNEPMHVNSYTCRGATGARLVRSNFSPWFCRVSIPLFLADSDALCFILFIFSDFDAPFSVFFLMLQGLVLAPVTEQEFATPGENPIGFQFWVADIQEIRPIVRVSKTCTPPPGAEAREVDAHGEVEHRSEIESLPTFFDRRTPVVLVSGSHRRACSRVPSLPLS